MSKRTIYRDLIALQEAGFPLVDEARDNHTYWTLDAHPFRHLTQLGFSLSELCALYLSRRLVESLTGIPFQAALGDAFGKFEREIKPAMKAYLDCLPSVMSARPTGGKVALSAAHSRMIEQLVDASVERRQVRMLYFSLSHERKAEYLVYPAPLRLHARRDVPAGLGAGPRSGADVRGAAHHGGSRCSRNGSTRTRHGRRIRSRARSGPTTAPRCTWSSTWSASSRPSSRNGSTTRASARSPRPDGSLTLELDVCNDVWLHSFVLQFGHRVQVLEPASLAREISEELDLARGHYAPAGQVEPLATSQALLDLSNQWRLPF